MNNELNKIEDAIREIDPATFQKLCDEYLKRKIGGHLVSSGSEDGRNKTTKGTPDSYIITRNGDFYLIEYTTQEKRLLQKINDDLKKIEELQINNKKIKGIIYCSSTSNINPNDVDAIQERYENKNIKFEIFSNYDIALDIQKKYRDLARKYLNFELIPPQMKDIFYFASEYNTQFNGSFLNTYFGYRNTELERIKKDFKTSNVVLLTGDAGVGKTRLAFEFAKSFFGEKFFIHNIYDIHDLILEMQTKLQGLTPKLVVFDDANQIDNLKKVFQALLLQLHSGKIKILITVRNYAKNKVENELKNCISTRVIDLHSLTSEQIKECVKKVYKINDEIILDRICEISYGNLRMAMLTAHAYIKNENIADESQAYDTLLGDAIQSISQDDTKLVNLGIIAFLKHFDINLDNSLYMTILNELGISFDSFRKDIDLFNKNELIDFVNSRFVNFSDQTLENYVLKVVFLDKKLLSLSKIIKISFSSVPDLVYQHVIDLNNIFYNKQNKKYLTEQIRKAWKGLKNRDNSQYLKFVAFFADFDIDEAIILVNERLHQMKQYTGKVNFKIKNGEIFDDPILKIIDSIMFSGEYKYATDLLYNYLIKQPQKFSQFYLAITQGWRITYITFRYWKFKSQLCLINKLIKKSSNQEVVNQLLLSIIPNYLALIIENIDEAFNNKNRVVITHFQLTATKENLNFRKHIWNYLIKIVSNYPVRVKKIVENYGKDLLIPHTNKISSSTKKVINFDIKYLTDIIKNIFNAQSVSDCIAISQLQERFISVGVKFPIVNVFINNKDYKLYKDLQNIVRSKTSDRQNSFKEYVKLNLSNGILDLKRILRIISDLETHNISIQTIELGKVLEIILDNLKSNKKEFINGIKAIIFSKFYDNFLFSKIFEYLISAYSSSQVISLLNDAPKDKKDFLYYIYFCCLPQNRINSKIYNSLVSYLSHETIEDINIYPVRNFYFLNKFNIIDSHAMEHCCRIICSKGKALSKVYFHSFYLSESRTEKVVDSFSDLKLLERIYLDCILNDKNDYSTHYFLAKIYKKEKLFLNTYINKVLIKQLKNYSLEDDQTLLELLRENKSIEILTAIWNILWKTNNHFLQIGWIETLVTLIKDVNDIKDDIDNWIRNFIKENRKNNLKIEILMGGIAYKDISLLIKYMKEYILTKPRIENFKKMPLCSMSYSMSSNVSSIKKVFNSYIDNLKELSTWIEDQGLDYILYKKEIDETIKRREEDLEEELGKLQAGMF